jgi:hypothetical protein
MFNKRARLVAALGEHRMIPIAKDDVIAYLAAAAWPPNDREAMYRSWCEVVGLAVNSKDLERARAGRRRELNRKLFP